MDLPCAQDVRAKERDVDATQASASPPSAKKRGPDNASNEQGKELSSKSPRVGAVASGGMRVSELPPCCERIWRSCPLAWCSWRRVTAFAGESRAGQLAIAVRLTLGSSLNGAIVSSVM